MYRMGEREREIEQKDAKNAKLRELTAWLICWGI